ncbi:hypothetical protein [Candidatus Poriferisocius sp.]|uniref:hypothetical protein n=1 Tax=Candidatus Poriferisocius sp. TaxID=3101276 RepID=UPI003B0274E7
MITEWITGISASVIAIMLGGGFVYMFKYGFTKIDALDTKLDTKIDTLDTKFDAKFDKQNEVIADMGKDVAIVVDRLRSEMNTRFNALDTKFDAKFDKQNEVIADMAKDVAIIVDRLGIDDRLEKRYPPTTQPQPPETRIETAV